VVLQFLIAGLVLGGIYAISSAGLVITYQSCGILNFSFGAMAYTVARFYYFLNGQHFWPIVPAALLSILGLGPALGLFLYLAVFRLLSNSSTPVKVLATIGISVALPSLDTVIFGTQEILEAPGLAPEPVHVYRFIGVPVTLDQIIVYSVVVVLMLAGFFVLRYTDIGLQIRALVDSPAMTSLVGTNPGRISMAVWAISSTLAGLTGVLVAPISGLDAGQMTFLMVAAFAAVIAGRLVSLPIAVFVGLGMGVVSALFQYFLPPGSTYTADLLYAIPFLTMIGFLGYFIVRRGSIAESPSLGGAIDRAIRPHEIEAVQAVGESGAAKPGRRSPLFAFACLLVFPLLLHGVWIGLVAQGVAYAIVFLSFSLVTGDGGMIWLCQATFAGAGGMAAALLSAHEGVPILLAVLIGGFIAVPFGLLIGWISIRLGDLYVAIVTLSFALFVENVVFIQQIFSNSGLGVIVHAPQFAAGTRILTYLTIGAFALVALIIVNFRRSTIGLALAAVRSSVNASKSIGISVVQMKVLLAGLAAFVAGIGGGFMAITLGSGSTTNYATLAAEVWLVILVTLGIRSNVSALCAGLTLALTTGLVLVYLPKIYGNLIAIVFGLGAVALIRFPEGVVITQARQFRSVLARFRMAKPKVYGAFRFAAAVYVVVFIVLVAAVSRLWWLWLLTTLALQGIVAGYMLAKTRNAQSPTVLAASPDRVIGPAQSTAR
jgi:branched-chain amino acid transport system permease protein